MKKVFSFLQASFLSIIPVFADDFSGDSIKPIRLREVEVISVRATDKTPVTYSNLSKGTIESFNFGQDIPYILTLTPSVISTSDAGTGIGYTGFRIRGTDANRINVTVNDVPLNDSESHGVFWVNMPDFASSVEDMQIQRGVGTSTNGAGAFGASVNMKTDNIPQTAFSEFNGTYGSFNTSKATFRVGTGLINDHWNFEARLSSINSDGFIDRADVDLKSYFAQGSYFNKNTFLKFITFSGKEQTYHAWDGVPDYILFPSEPGEKSKRTYNNSGYMGEDANGNPLYYANQTDNYQQTHYQLRFLQVFNPQLNFNLSLHYTNGFGYYEEYKTRRTLKEYGLNNFVFNGETVKKSDLVRQKFLDNDFGGFVFSFNYNPNKWAISLGGGANQYDGNHYGLVKWIKNYAGGTNLAPEHEYYRSKGKKSDANLYLKGSYQALENLSIYGDLQFRRIDYRIDGKNDTWDWLAGEMQNLDIHKKFNFFNPKAGLFYQLNKEQQVYTSWAIARREPNRNNYTDAGINDIPKSEKLSDIELGYKYGNARFSSEVNLYYMLYKDQLVLNGKVNEIGEPLTSNVPDSYRAGIEWAVGAQIISCLKWDGNLTLSRNRIKDYTEYVPVYDSDDNMEAAQQADYYGSTPIAYSPDLIANSLFTFTHKNFGIGFHSHYVGKQYLDNTGNTDKTISAYFVNNLRLSYNFKIKGIKESSVHLLLNNILNEKYETNGWLWSCYYRQNDGGLDGYTEKNYFPQAGMNVLASLRLQF